MEVEYASRFFRVLVRDDGSGIDQRVLDEGREGHWGLPGMRERAQNIGASLKLRSRIGSGTEVELTIPGASAYEGQAGGLISQGIARLTGKRSIAVQGTIRSEATNGQSTPDSHL